MEIKSVLLGLVIGAFLVLGGMYFYPTVADEIIPDGEPEYSFVMNSCNDIGIWDESHGGQRYVKFREDGTGEWGDWHQLPEFTYTVMDDHRIQFTYPDQTTENREYEFVNEFEMKLEINGEMATFYEYRHVPQ